MISTTTLCSDEFVGRHEELEFLFEEFGDARNGRARFVVIDGEAGIGKSRLVGEFIERMGQSASVANAACLEQIRRPYLAIEALLAQITRRMRGPTPRRNAGLREEKAAFFESIADLLRRESSRTPIVLAIEDIQWADDATLELLRYLAQHLDGVRALFVFTLRTGDAIESPAIAKFRSVLARARSATIGLRGLKPTGVRTLVQRMTGGAGTRLGPEVISQIENLSDGNPLYAEELTRLAIENGEISLGTQLPLSVAALLSERLAAFDERERNILIRAAIVGDRFEASFVAEIAEVLRQDVLTTVQRAVERGIVSPVPGSADAFAFRHSLIRQALADRLILGLAAPLHLRIARVLESGADPDAHAAELAYHYSQAREAEKARRYNERAAVAAREVYAYRDAIRFYIAALRWEYPPGPERGALYEQLGTLLYIEGAGEEPAAWFERALAEYERFGNDAGRTRALLSIADQFWVDARTTDSLRAAADAGSPLSLARFAMTLANPMQAAAQLRRFSKAHLQRDVPSRAMYHEIRAEVRAAAGDTSGAFADCRQAALLAAQSGESELIAQIENNFALVAADLGELALAEEHHLVALAEAQRTGMMWRVAYCALGYAQTLMLRGELRRAREQTLRALECGVTTATFKTRAASVGIPLALALNDRALLRGCADEAALEYAFRSGEMQRIACVGAAFAELRAAQGALDEARDMLRRALSHVSHGYRSWSLWIQAGLLARADDVAVARTVLAGSTGRPRMLRAHGLLLAALAARETDARASARIARVAAKLFDRMGFRWNAALALEVAGDRAGALAEYRVMGAVRDAERLAKPRGAAARGHELTARQRQIAAFVAEGHTNRAIADLLHISEHTVEHHLSALFARLGIKSRAALSALVASGKSE